MSNRAVRLLTSPLWRKHPSSGTVLPGLVARQVQGIGADWLLGAEGGLVGGTTAMRGRSRLEVDLMTGSSFVQGVRSVELIPVPSSKMLYSHLNGAMDPFLVMVNGILSPPHLNAPQDCQYSWRAPYP